MSAHIHLVNTCTFRFYCTYAKSLLCKWFRLILVSTHPKHCPVSCYSLHYHPILVNRNLSIFEWIQIWKPWYSRPLWFCQIILKPYLHNISLLTQCLANSVGWESKYDPGIGKRGDLATRYHHSTSMVRYALSVTSWMTWPKFLGGDPWKLVVATGSIGPS